MDISEAIGEYLDSKQNSITAKTYEWYDAFLTTFKKWCDEQHLTDLSQITAPIVQRFVAACPTDSSNTRHHRAQVVKGEMVGSVSSRFILVSCSQAHSDRGVCELPGSER